MLIFTKTQQQTNSVECERSSTDLGSFSSMLDRDRVFPLNSNRSSSRDTCTEQANQLQDRYDAKCTFGKMYERERKQLPTFCILLPRVVIG